MKKPAKGSGRAKRVRAASAAIAEALQKRGLAEEIRAERLITEWVDLAGDRIAKRTRPIGIVDRVLRVEVATAAWMHELNLLRPQLLAGLFARFGEPRLFDDLKLVLAGRSKYPIAPPRRMKPPAPDLPHPVGATPIERMRIEHDTAAIEDPELREIIARVRIKNGR